MNIESDSKMRVALAKFDMFFPYTHSLKEKRYALRKMKDKIYAQFKISLHEVAHHDKWQRTTLGLAVVGNDASLLNAIVDKVINRIHDLDLGQVLDSVVEVIDF